MAATRHGHGALRRCGAFDVVRTGPADARVHLVLAHGAGAPMTSPFLEAIAEALARHGIACSRFEFAYMARRRTDGVRQPPPPIAGLANEWRARLDAMPLKVGERRLIGGKSMGGRAASLIADDLYDSRRIAGLVCLGYPFHPVGKPQTTRVGHLTTMACPALIVQGTRDPFGTREEIAGYALSPAIQFAWLDGGDHDFKPARGSGMTQSVHIAAAAAAVAAFSV